MSDHRSCLPRFLTAAMLLTATWVAITGCDAAERKPADKPSGGKPMTIKLTSTAFEEGKPIPKKHTGDGQDMSPPLAWSNVPKETKELALICDDPDAPRKDPWDHWVIYKMPSGTAGLPEGVPRKAQLKEPAGALQGVNSWPSDNVGYRGPMPPPGKPHRYFFRLYALDAPLDVKPGLDKGSLLKKMEGHILAQGQLMGTYQK